MPLDVIVGYRQWRIPPALLLFAKYSGALSVDAVRLLANRFTYPLRISAH
jgi:hypothetical protein